MSFQRLLQTFSLVGLIKYFILKIKGKDILISGSCTGCGMCCKRLNLEGSTGWLRSEKEFYDVVREYPEFERFEIIEKDEQGFLVFTCSWCTKDGLCENYEDRLALCKNFPEKSLVFSGGKLPEGCGYSFKQVVPFEKVLATEKKKLDNDNEKNSNP